MWVIFTKPKCSFSSKTRKLLSKKGKQFVDIKCKDRDDLMEKIKQHKFRVPNTLTFPRIYFNKKLIGGFTELEKKLK